MISFLSSARPSLKITVEQDIIFVHPLQNLFSGGPDEPTIDPEVRGTVLLNLPQSKAVKSLKVVFEGLCNAWGGEMYSYESTTTLHKELYIDLKGEVLEAGDHAFNFSFIIPSNTAVYQRCNYGRVRHYVKAFLEYGTGFSTSNVNSSPVGIFISAQPTLNVGDIPPPMDILLDHVSDDIGPVRLALTSPHLTPASLLSTQVTFLAPTKSLQLHSIKTILQQQFSIHYPDADEVAKRIAEPKEDRFVLKGVERPRESVEIAQSGVERGWSGGCRGTGSTNVNRSVREEEEGKGFELREGEERMYERIMRVPDDDHVRPTTLSGTEARIRVAHRLSIEIRYKCPTTGEEKLLTVGRNVVVSSCCCLLDTLYLPAYQKSAPKTITKPVAITCFCSMSLKEMFDNTGMGLERARALPGPPYVPGGERVLGRARNGQSILQSVADEKSPSMEWVRGTEGISDQ